MDWTRMAAETSAVVAEVTAPEFRKTLETAARVCAASMKAGGKILACGNGGSAADAQHFTAELVGRYLLNRAPYAAITLNTDTSIMTAVGNDFGFENIFAKQVEALGKCGDVLVCFSTSGKSGNMVRAAHAARAAGLTVIGVTGRGGGAMAAHCDHLICIRSTDSTPRIQEGHQMILHAICEMVEETLR